MRAQSTPINPAHAGVVRRLPGRARLRRADVRDLVPRAACPSVPSRAGSGPARAAAGRPSSAHTIASSAVSVKPAQRAPVRGALVCSQKRSGNPVLSADGATMRADARTSRGGSRDLKAHAGGSGMRARPARAGSPAWTAAVRAARGQAPAAPAPPGRPASTDEPRTISPAGWRLHVRKPGAATPGRPAKARSGPGPSGPGDGGARQVE